MKITMKPETVESLENITGKKITRNGDEAVQRVCDIASGGCQKTGAWLEPEPKESENESS